MKLFLILTNIATVGVIAFLYFNGNIGSTNSRAAKCNTCTNICADYSGKGITKYDISVLEKMSYYYKNTTGSKTASSNIWFSLDTLKRFIWNIEKGTCGLKCDNNENFNAQLGIRIYFARYPDAVYMKNQPDLINVDPNFADQQTLFMIPTFDSIGSNKVTHIDFDPSNIGTFNSQNCIFRRIDGTSGPVTAMGFNSTLPPPPVGGPTSTTAQNHGGLCPPVCDGGQRF
jgi:hypothetical protein